MVFEPNVTLNKIAWSIAHTLGKPDDYFLREKIKFEAIQFRALLLRRDLERNNITKNFIQWLKCLELECVDVATCCSDIKGFDNIFRTVEKIPIPLRTKSFDSFYYVGTIDKRNGFKEVNFTDLDLMEYRRFTKNKPMFIYSEDHIYVSKPPTFDFKYITVASIFEDPSQIKDCDGNNCYTHDDIFPIGADQYPALSEYLLNIFGNQRVVEDPQIKINDN